MLNKCRECGDIEKYEGEFDDSHPDRCYGCCMCFDYHEDCEYCGTAE